MERFKNILLVVTPNTENHTAIQKAVGLARSNQARLTIIKVLEQNAGFLGFFSAHKVQHLLEEELGEERARLRDEFAPFAADMELEFMVVRGKFSMEVIAAVLRHGFDIVVKTCAPPGGLTALFYGSVDMDLLRQCPCPVWLIKAGGEVKNRRIMAAVDLQPSDDDGLAEALNQQILEMSTSLALAEFAELHIVHAWLVFGENMVKSGRYGSLDEEFAQWVADQHAELKARCDAFKGKTAQLLGGKGSEYLEPVVHFVKGEASEVVPRLAKEKEVDLVVMGTIARTGIPGLLMGNTAESILNQLHCSVLAVKPRGFESPVKIA